MAIKDIQTNKNELQEYLLLIAKVPEKINKIDIDIKRELLIDIENRISYLVKVIVSLIENNPNYPYPENYLPDKLFDYWAVRVNQLFNYYELNNLKVWIEKSIDTVKTPEAIKENNLLPNPYDHIFKNGNVYECFNKYIENYIIDFYIDISYLKKRMLKENLIHNIKDIPFMNFLLNDLKITPPPKQYSMFINNDSKLLSLNKSNKDPNREINFDIVFKSCF